jgi:DNA-binding Xre family transcriptional regulator
LETVEGRRITTQELSEFWQISDTALSDWSTGKTNLYQIEGLLKLCERVDRCWLNDLFHQHLLAFPTLRSPELAHDPGICCRLKSLLQETIGITCIIGGGGDTLRTFLFCALGHSYLQSGAPRSVVGWDMHPPPHWFVPIPGILYLRGNEHQPGALQEDGVQGLVMSNGLWRFAQHRTHLIHLSRRRHVVVADALLVEQLRADVNDTRIPFRVLELGGELDRLEVTWQVG